MEPTASDLFAKGKNDIMMQTDGLLLHQKPLRTSLLLPSFFAHFMRISTVHNKYVTALW